MTRPQTAGDRNPTQIYLYRLRSAREVKSTVRIWAAKRHAQDVPFYHRVSAVEQYQTLLSVDAIAFVLTLDDVIHGRWQDPAVTLQMLEHQERMLQLSDIAMAQVRDFKIESVSLVAHPPVDGCIELSPQNPICPKCGVGYIEVEP